MKIEQQFEEALATENPDFSLDILVKSLLKDGYDRNILLDEIDKFHVFLHKQGRIEEEDLINDIYLAMVGWCHPDSKI
jgi:hypothetical protein